MSLKSTDNLWTRPYMRYVKRMILNKPGDVKMPDLFAVYARGIRPNGELIDERKIPEKIHTTLIHEALFLEMDNQIPNIPSVQLEIGQMNLFDARDALEWAIQSSINLKDIGLESLPNPIARPSFKEKLSFPSLNEFARIGDPEIVVLNEKTICTQSLSLESLYVALRRSSLRRCVKGIGPN